MNLECRFRALQSNSQFIIIQMLVQFSHNAFDIFQNLFCLLRHVGADQLVIFVDGRLARDIEQRTFSEVDTYSIGKDPPAYLARSTPTCLAKRPRSCLFYSIPSSSLNFQFYDFQYPHLNGLSDFMRNSACPPLRAMRRMASPVG